jgi:uncharacterized delta-60 repeat protein
MKALYHFVRATTVAAALLAWCAIAATDGAAALSTAANYEAFVGAMRTASGAIVAAGNIGTSQGSDLVVARFTRDGRPDPSFGVGGIAMHDAGARDDSLRAMLALADGRIVAVGQSGGRALVAMFRADGSLDPGFGIGGLVRSGVIGAARSGLSSVSLRPDGGLIATGSALLGDGEHVLVVALDARGTLDARFDLDGLRVVRELNGADSRSLILADGRIVVAARAPGAVMLMRFDASGALDPSFGIGGIASAPGSGATPIVALAAIPEGYVVAERAAARVTLFDSNGTPRLTQELATGSALMALARATDGRIALALGSPTAASGPVQVGAATLRTVGPSITRPRTQAEILAARRACTRLKVGRAACLAATRQRITVPGAPIPPNFAVGSSRSLPVTGAEVLALQPGANGALLVAGFRFVGADTDYLLAQAQLSNP